MPLFKHRNETSSPPPNEVKNSDAPRSKGSIFTRRRRSSSPLSDNDRVSNTNDTHTTHSSGSGGFFSRRRSRSTSNESLNSRGFNSSIHGRHLNDPSIINARHKVSEAEEAERQADRALAEARTAVREAKQHVKNLEREIEEEARLHKLKQQEAKTVSKTAKGLGRHG